MDSITSTDDLNTETKYRQENILLDIIKEVCCASDSKLSSKLIGKVNRIIADCDLTHHSSLHKLSTADESTATVLGFMNQTATELTFDEQTELNEAILNRIQTKLPIYNAELNQLQEAIGAKKSHKNTIQELQKSLDDKITVLKEQENEKVDLMMEWLNHRLHYVSTFTNNTTELLTLKTKILEVKSRIMHLNILQNIYMETNDSIKAYTEIHKDLKDSIKETEQRIKDYKEIIQNS
ncbi:uncharacterized protein LOC123711064 [Pieris brassicae]|uniref:Uncharacterized protein n=1 Tax=Pieris brassicae TaxID=7116 RepID=A0A9P0TVC9_PIEBR|nr:uncharacterized protein LOC123711064 [Pieris brassicae]CAH4038233.1 unnamed protein product [Pieris brassicae]